MTAHKLYQRVEIKKKSGTSWSGTATVLTEATEVEVKLGIGKIKDTFSFRLVNSFNKYFSSTATIEEDDKVKIYIWRDITWASLTTQQKNNALLIEGLVTSVRQAFDPNSGRYIVIEGVGFMDIIFKGLAFINSVTITKPHEMIQNVIAQINSINRAFGRVIYGEDSGEWTALSNATTRRDGTAFNTTNYVTSYKSAVEIIEELSSDEYTGDGNYIYKVTYDSTNDRYEFIWLAKSLVEDESLEEGTDKINQINLLQTKDDIINAIIFHFGFDCNNRPQEDFYWSPTAIGAGGGSWKYLTTTQTILPTIILNEQLNNSTLFDTDDDGNFKSAYPSSYDNGGGIWTFQFKERDTSGKPTATDATATDADSYNAAIVTEGRFIALGKAINVVNRFGEARWGGKIILPSNTNYRGGELLKLTSSSYNMTDMFIRVEQVVYDIWTSILELKEDEKSIVTTS